MSGKYNETPAMDRLFYLVAELLEAGEDPREIIDTCNDAIRDWRMAKPEERGAPR